MLLHSNPAAELKSCYTINNKQLAQSNMYTYCSEFYEAGPLNIYGNVMVVGAKMQTNGGPLHMQLQCTGASEQEVKEAFNKYFLQFEQFRGQDTLCERIFNVKLNFEKVQSIELLGALYIVTVS